MVRNRAISNVGRRTSQNMSFIISHISQYIVISITNDMLNIQIAFVTNGSHQGQVLQHLKNTLLDQNYG